MIYGVATARNQDTQENCFKLHGKEQVLSKLGGFKGISNGQANLTHQDNSQPKQTSSSSIDIKEEIERLKGLLDTLSKSSSSCSFVWNGVSFLFLLMLLEHLHLIVGYLILVLLTI